MSDTTAGSTIALVLILMLYASVGISAAIGTTVVTRKLFASKWEQIFYAGLLMAVAAYYLAFATYFGEAKNVWQTETTAVFVFCGIALIGVQLPVALMLGYILHGGWDFLHELQAHGAASIFEPGHTTAIPLAYGVFCAMFDVGIAIYFYLRRGEWSAAWKTA